jgi:hypothetical protein
MIRRLSIVVIAVAMGTLTAAAPAGAATPTVQINGILHCC